MHRMAYRNFGDHESIVFNHTVDVMGDDQGKAGIRWYELRGLSGTPVIHQQGTYAPDANATQGQISKIVSEAAGITDPPNGQTYQDVPSTNTFYVWIERLTGRGVMSGYPCGGPGEPCGPGNRPYFRPNANATRGQVSKIVGNIFFPGCVTP